jgi:hypothetical protein
MNVVVKSNWKVLPMPLKDKKFRSLTTATVDNELWYTVQCKQEVSNWLRSQSGENSLWFQNIDDKWMTNANTFDVHNKIYTLIALKWAS